MMPLEKRPWGSYVEMMELPGILIKMLRVNPNKRLSLQSHKNRDEHWIIAKGVGEMEIDGKIWTVRAGDAVHIPRNARHRVKNVGTCSLIISEVWLGDQLSEDDITRYEDDFGRVNIG